MREGGREVIFLAAAKKKRVARERAEEATVEYRVHRKWNFIFSPSSSTSYPILGRRLRAGNLILSARPSLTLAPLQKWAPETLTDLTLPVTR